MNNDLISREALKNYARTVLCEDNITNTSLIRVFDEIIDNATTVESETEGEKKTDNLPSCNSCSHNGTWDCINCRGFDRYERG